MYTRVGVCTQKRFNCVFVCTESPSLLFQWCSCLHAQISTDWCIQHTPPHTHPPPPYTQSLSVVCVSKVPDPHRLAALHHPSPPAQLSAQGAAYPPPAPAGPRLRHPHGGEVAPGLLQVGQGGAGWTGWGGTTVFTGGMVHDFSSLVLLSPQTTLPLPPLLPPLFSPPPPHGFSFPSPSPSPPPPSALSPAPPSSPSPSPIPVI